MPYLSEQVEFYNKKPRDIIQYNTVEFSADDLDTVRLVANQHFNKQFYVDGILQTFTAVSMKMPNVSNQNSDTSTQSTLYFGRISNVLLPILRERDPLLSHNPITATMRMYRSDQDDPIYTLSAYIPKDGITYDGDNVNIKLSADNPSRLGLPTLFYDPAIWTGLALV